MNKRKANRVHESHFTGIASADNTVCAQRDKGRRQVGIVFELCCTFTR